MTNIGDNEDSGQLAARLVTEHAPRLRNLARKYGRGGAEEEDLAQEVYVRMRSVNADAIRNPESYLITVALNVLREWDALRRRECATVDVDDPLAPGAFRELSVTPSFGAIIDSEQFRRRLRSALAELRPKCRAAVSLHYFHGMKCEEVAEKLGLSTEMVRKYVKQALAHCRRRMAHLEWTDDE